MIKLLTNYEIIIDSQEVSKIVWWAPSSGARHRALFRNMQSWDQEIDVGRCSNPRYRPQFPPVCMQSYV